MAIAITNLGRGAGNDTTSFNSDSVSPTGDNLVLASVFSRTGISADPNQPTLSGNGITWVAIATIVYDSTSSSRRRITLFRGMVASPSAGAITVDFGGQTQTHAGIIIDQASGVDTGGTNGSAAIVQSATGEDETATVSTITITLGAFGDAANATYGAFADGGGAATWTPGSGFTELDEEEVGGSIGGTTEYKLSNDTSVDITNSITNQLGGVAIEIKAAVVATDSYSGRGVGRGIGRGIMR